MAFQSHATNLSPDDSNSFSDVFVKDLTTGTLALVSANPSFLGHGNYHSEHPKITADGTAVVFDSLASNLTADDKNNPYMDVFVATLASGSSMTGGSDKDMLVGTALGDLLSGGAGDDFLYGGAGGDTFLFEIGHGKDVVTDFSPLQGDRLRLAGLGDGLDSAAETLGAALQIGSDTLITTSPTTSIWLKGVSASDLTSEYFLFA